MENVAEGLNSVLDRMFPDVGRVYLMRNMRNGLTKIGYTRRHPEFRERTLQSEEPEVELAGFWPGTRRDERRLHAAYAECRVRGEWFDLSRPQCLRILEEGFRPLLANTEEGATR